MVKCHHNRKNGVVEQKEALNSKERILKDSIVS